jgi:hypothetical protein
MLSIVTRIPWFGDGRFGDGIEAAGVPRVAAQEALQCQAAAAHQPEAIDGLQRILGATWIKAAVISEEGAHRVLVSANP